MTDTGTTAPPDLRRLGGRVVRYVFGIVAAPFCGALFAHQLMTLVAEGARSGLPDSVSKGFFDFILNWVVGYVSYSALVSYIGSVVIGWPAMLVIGLPLHLLFTKLKWFSATKYVLLGAFTALAGFWIFRVFVFFANDVPLGGTHLSVLSTVAGAIGGWIFWLIVVRSAHSTSHTSNIRGSAEV